MAITQKQERYARLVASGIDLHTAALEAGCKNHEAARKFVADMAKRENVQAFIQELKIANTIPTADAEQTDRPTDRPKSYETPLEFLKAVFNNVGGVYSPKERISAAIALLPYTEQKMAAVGKKEDALDTAKAKSENGRFATLSHQGDMFESEIRQ